MEECEEERRNETLSKRHINHINFYHFLPLHKNDMSVMYYLFQMYLPQSFCPSSIFDLFRSLHPLCLARSSGAPLLTVRLRRIKKKFISAPIHRHLRCVRAYLMMDSKTISFQFYPISSAIALSLSLSLSVRLYLFPIFYFN